MTKSYTQDWDHQQANRTLNRITQLLNLNCMKMMMGMGFPMPRNVMMNQPLSHTTHTLVLRQFCQKEMTWFLELSSQGSRILKDSPLEKLIRIQSWTQGSTMSNSQMVRIQNWEQISLQNACILNVTLKVTMDHIVDHRKDNKPVCKDNQDVTFNSKTYKQKTTRGWHLYIEWER